MKTARTLFLAISRSASQKLLALMMLLLVGASSHALEALQDSELDKVNGTGIALAFDNFSFRMAPTSYIEMTGSDLTDNTGIVYDAALNGGQGGCRLSTSPAGTGALAPSACDPYDQPANWRRGDLRYYGFSITNGSGAATDWFGNGCTAGTDGLGCPIGTTGIKDFASVYNPYMIRVFQYAGYSYQGACLGTESAVATPVAGVACDKVSLATSPTFYEFIGPSKGDAWRWAFWGQIKVDNSATNILQSQSIIIGRNSTTDNKPTRLLITQTPTSVASEQSLSVIYQSRLSGSFRFSVMQRAGSPNADTKVPDFDDTEGLYFKQVDAYLPLGQPNYQTVVFRNSGTNGDFIVELTPVLPDATNGLKAPNTFYCGASNCLTASFTGGVGVNGSNSATGCANGGTCNRSIGAAALQSTDTVVDPTDYNADSHGYVYWGSQAGAGPTATDATNGIYFNGPSGVVNIGRAMVKGMLIQSMKITSLGVGG